MFCVVEMEDEGGKSVEAIPESWILPGERKCHWPPIKNPTKKIAQKEAPDHRWSLYSCRVLKKYASYVSARQALRTAQYTSDLQSESESPKRRRVSKPRTLPFRSDSSEDDEETTKLSKSLSHYPPPPTMSNEMDLISENEIFEIEEVLNATGRPLSVCLTEVFPSSAVQDSAQVTGLSTTGSIPINHLSVKSASVPETGLMELLKKLVQDVALIKVTVKNNENRLQSIEKSISSLNRISLPEGPKLLPPRPIDNQLDFLTFEESITDNNKHQFISEMVRCGGSTLVEFVGRVLRKLITDELGLIYSMWGLKGNLNFSNTKSWGVLHDAALSIKKLGATDKDTLKAGSEWFRHCNDRIKQKRRKSAAAIGI